jgi:ribosomal protein S18 acetylase RimI-like enzyme
MIYIQMRLPIEKINEEFEDLLKEKIEHNIIQASIRRATKDDLESVMNLYNKSWLTSNTPFRPISLDALKTILTDPDTAFLIARVYGKDAGFAILDFDGENNEYGIIAGLGVLPRFQRRGLGTILGLAIWNYLKEKDVTELRCEVYKENNISYRFIKWLGFKEYGKIIYTKSDFANNQ